MTRILFFGASIVYGVGDTNGGFVTSVKRKVNQIQYGENGRGDKIEVYNFAKPGVTIEFVNQIYKPMIEKFAPEGEILSIVSVGMNNTKAINEPNNYISSLDDFSESLSNLNKMSDKIIALGYTPVDESKADQKPNPIDGSISYWKNNRIELFNNEFKKVANNNDIKFIDLFTKTQKINWTQEYTYKDGLHPNTKGHEFIFSQVYPVITNSLNI